MFFVLSKILDVLLSPLVWALACFAVAMPWRRPPAPGSWRRRRLLAGAGIAILYVFSLQPVANALAWRLEHATSATMKPDVTYDAVVLLGGMVDEHVVAMTGQPSFNDNVERVVATHKLLAEGRARYAIVSSAPSAPDLGEAGEARVLARQLVAWGIEPGRILLEERARNTYENAVYSKEIAAAHGVKTAVVVTSAFHMQRAAECFRAAQFPVDTYLVDFRARPSSAPLTERVLPRTSALYQSSAMLRELFGGLVYRVRGYGKGNG